MAARLIATTLAIVGFICVGGCEKPSNSASSTSASKSSKTAKTTKACELLTQADAEHALSHPVVNLKADGGAGGLDICQYGYSGERLADSGNVSVTLHENPISALQKGVEEAGYHAEPVTGVGDFAFWSPETRFLYVGKGNRTALILIGKFGMTVPQDASVDLGRVVATRM